MKLYAVLGFMDYHGHTLLGVYETLQEANDLATAWETEEGSELHNGFDSYDVQPVEVGVTLTYENS